jgi:peptidoglycan/LPS O-acetylase OafA/YrhL
MIKKIVNHLFSKSPSSNVQINSLDGLRGIAILFVLLSHTSNAGINITPTLNFSGSGKYGVFLFFVLSAYLLTYQLLSFSKKDLIRIDFWFTYIKRRFFRVFPLFIIVLMTSYMFSDLFKIQYFVHLTFSELVGHIFLVLGKNIFWTIPVEFKWYLILPFVILCDYFILKKNLTIVLVVMIIFLYISNMFLWPPDQFNLNTVEVGPYVPIFITGSFAAIIQKRISNVFPRWSCAMRVTFDLISVVILILIIILIPSFTSILFESDIKPDYLHREYLFFGFLWSLLIVCQINGKGWFSRFLSFPFFRFLGIISFSLYLWHTPIVRLVNAHISINSAMSVLAIFLFSIIVSVGSYLLIERPFIEFAKKR